MQVNLNSGTRGALGKRMDLSTMPAVHTERAPRSSGVFLLIFSLVWGGVPTAVLVGALVNGHFQPAMLLILLFTVIGSGLFILGLRTLTNVTTIRFDEHDVSCESKWIFGYKSWRESLANYPGVVQRSEYHSGGKNRPSYTLYIVELHHDDKHRRVRLYESRSNDGIRPIWEDYCRQLGKPALEDDGGTLRARPVEDLDKSVRELAKEGKVDFTFDPSVPPPQGLTLSVQGDVLQVAMRKAKTSLPGMLLFLAIPSVFIYIGFFIKNVPVLFGVIGLIFLAVFLAAAVWAQVATAVLDISRGGVKLYWVTPWGNTPGMAMASDAIESVRIGAPAAGNTRTEVVLIHGDAATIPAGQGLDRAALEWLRNCILAVVTK